MKIQQLSADAALDSVRSRAGGLTPEEADQRLKEYGENRVERLERPPPWQMLVKEFTHLFALILWLAAALDDARRARLARAEARLAEQGLRVLALAWRDLPEATGREEWEWDLNLVGLVGLADPPRPEVPAAVHTYREAGIRVIMVTGDHPRTALAVAQEIGLVSTDAPLVMTGRELRRLSPTQLQLALVAPEAVFARLTADQKQVLVKALQAKGHVVAATGDGVNNAPALRAADIGVAMGRSGADVAREAADLVLLDDHFATIVAAVEEGRAVYQNLRKFLTYIL